MSKFLRVTLTVWLACLSVLAQAELYTWVDKNGKKHYGDTVPPEHTNKAQTVEAKKINTMPAPPSVNYYETPQHSDANAPSDAQENPAVDAEANSCEAQQQAYENSVACYNECRKHTKTHGKKINNISDCGECADAPKPHCE